MSQQPPVTLHAGCWGLWGLHCPGKSHSLPRSPLRIELSPRLLLPHLSPISILKPGAQESGVAPPSSLPLTLNPASSCVSSLHEAPGSHQVSPPPGAPVSDTPQAPEGTAAGPQLPPQCQVLAASPLPLRSRSSPHSPHTAARTMCV